MIKEAVGNKASPQDDPAYDEFIKEQSRKNWLAAWSSVTFKDLYGYPLWETQVDYSGCAHKNKPTRACRVRERESVCSRRARLTLILMLPTKHQHKAS